MPPSDTMAIFEQTYQKTHDWLRELCELGGLRDETQAYSVLRAVLHALRDRLTVEEGADLAAQLPMLVTGIYYDGWRPASVPQKERTKEAFLQSVRQECRNDVEVEAEQAVTAVFGLLGTKVTSGEIQDVKGILPQPVRELWP